MRHRLVASILAIAPLAAQTTWTVCASGGPGVQFVTLDAAVAAASDGDVILCLQPQFGMTLTGFTTSKGLTILGVGPAAIPIYATTGSAIVVQNVPSNRAFRMAGFQFIQDGQLRIDVQSCAGSVHFEDIGARDVDFFFPTVPSISIAGSASVTLKQVRTFGTPALQASNSRVLLEQCALGEPINGLRGGAGLRASNCEIDLVQCVVDTASTSIAPSVYVPAIDAVDCVLRIAGDSSARIAGAALGQPGGIPIVATRSATYLDPRVTLVEGLGQPTILATGSLALQSVPASWTSTATLGQNLTIRTAGPAGSALFLAIGAAAALQSTIFGTLGLDVLQPYSFVGAASPGATGTATWTLGVPAALPLGLAFCAQAVVAHQGQLTLAQPSQFVIRG